MERFLSNMESSIQSTFVLHASFSGTTASRMILDASTVVNLIQLICVNFIKRYTVSFAKEGVFLPDRRCMYMHLLSGRNTPSFAKDTVYRFMKFTQINWIRFTTVLASRIIRDAVVPLNDACRTNVLCIDDSMFERNRSKKVELLAKTYDHPN